ISPRSRNWSEIPGFMTYRDIHETTRISREGGGWRGGRRHRRGGRAGRQEGGIGDEPGGADGPASGRHRGGVGRFPAGERLCRMEGRGWWLGHGGGGSFRFRSPGNRSAAREDRRPETRNG